MLGQIKWMTQFALCLTMVSELTVADQPEFTWRDGDKVALIGGTVIEREQNFGHWEQALTRNIPAKGVTFRNLGWSGDTVWAESRGIFEPVDSHTPLESNPGYGRLIALVKEQKPSVLVFGYGQVEAAEGAAGLQPFVAQYERLIHDCQAGSTEGVRVILLGPMNLVKMPDPLPDPTAYNTHIEIYRAAIEQLAEKVGARYAPLVMPHANHPRDLLRITDNGQHLTSEGYALSASQLVSALTPGQVKEIKTGDEESQRKLINKKNELFFHRYRPQNVTYLFLFRKHEQGNNAVDIPKFDPLVADLEQQISATMD